MSDRDISVYRVGVLQALFMDWRALTLRLGPRWWALTHLCREWGYLVRQAKRRNWRAIRNEFNGWLAEHAYAGTRCGHGWTRSRALADLRRHLVEIGARS